jgi:hypothetical protein
MKNIAVSVCLCFLIFSSRFLCAFATSFADRATALDRAALDADDFFFFAAFFLAFFAAMITPVSGSVHMWTRPLSRRVSA